MTEIVIIDPSSTELNRGSFCYGGYLISNALREMHYDVKMVEAFRSEDLDLIPAGANQYVVMLWSYPQVEAAIFLYHMLPNATFAGYTPLIDYLGLPHMRSWFGSDPLVNPNFLRIAMQHYPKYYSTYARLLLSDCDMHLKSRETHDKVYPLFTSYGCPNECQFCPSTKNCEASRIVLSVNSVEKMLSECHNLGIRHIHFTDEDFFFSAWRANTILEGMKGMGFHTIALGSSGNVRTFIERYGIEILNRAGMEVIEIGFETADENIAQDMGDAKSISHCYEIAVCQPELRRNNVGVFWLAQTFFPGESLVSLNRTGEFMQVYGYEMHEVVGRLRTNGTKGGLGQFFQPYHGLPLYNDLKQNGLFLTDRPVRLIPSYVPNSFLESTVRQIHVDKIPDAQPWLDLYNVDIAKINFDIGKRLGDEIHKKDTVTAIHNAVGLAILARMGVIE